MLDFVSSISLPVIISSLPREKVCSPDIRVGYRRRGSIFIRDWRGMGGRSRLLRKNRFSYIHGGKGGRPIVRWTRIQIELPWNRNVTAQVAGTGTHVGRKEGGDWPGMKGRGGGEQWRGGETRAYILFSLCTFGVFSKRWIGTFYYLGRRREWEGKKRRAA